MVQKMAGVSGSELYYLNVLPALVKRGVEASFLVMERRQDTRLNDAFAETLGRAGVQVIRRDYRSELSLPLLRRIAKVVRDGRYDLVQSNLIHADVWLAAVKRLLIPGMTLISAKHGYVEGYQSRHGLNPQMIRLDPMSLATRIAARQANRVLTISKGLANLFAGSGMISPDKITVIPYGFTFQEIESQIPAGKLRFGTPQIVSIGRLVAYKQHDLLLRAFTPIAAEHSSARLVIVGGGPADQRLKNLADELGIGGMVVFTGRSGNAHNYLRDSDLFVFPSSSEGFGAVILEAWHHSLPVIAFDVPAPNEVITDGEDGFLVTPFDVGQLTNRMQQLIHAPELRRTMGQQGLKTLRTHYSIDRMTDATLKLYEEVVAG